MKTIRLQGINGHLYPTDAISAQTLEEHFGLGRIPGNKAWRWFSSIVGAGFKMAIVGDLTNIDI